MPRWVDARESAPSSAAGNAGAVGAMGDARLRPTGSTPGLRRPVEPAPSQHHLNVTGGTAGEGEVCVTKGHVGAFSTGCDGVVMRDRAAWHAPRMEFLDWLQHEGGVCTVQAARAWMSKPALDTMRGTTIWSPLRGWVALVGVQNDATRALQAGGVASCVTAFAVHGLWLPHGPQRLHLRARRNTHSARVTTTRAAEGLVLHVTHNRLADTRPPFGVDPPLSALATAAGCISRTELMAAADTALARALVSHDDLSELAAVLPRRRRHGLEWATGKAGSGSESEFAALLRSAGIEFTQQSEVLPHHFVDFLIGRSLIIEIDSNLWHGTPAQQAADRARDAEFTRRGYRVVRFTYEQVLFQPTYAREVVLDLVRRGAHTSAPWN